MQLPVGSCTDAINPAPSSLHLIGSCTAPINPAPVQLLVLARLIEATGDQPLDPGVLQVEPGADFDFDPVGAAWVRALPVPAWWGRMRQLAGGVEHYIKWRSATQARPALQ